MMHLPPSDLPPVPASLRALAAAPYTPQPNGAALHLKRLATHLRVSQEVMLSKCSGPQGTDYSRLLVDYDAAKNHLRHLLQGLRLLRKQHNGIAGPAPGEDPWFHPSWQPFLRASNDLITLHLPPVFDALKRHRAVLKGRPYSQRNAA